MITFVTWVIFIGVGVAACVWLVLVSLILARLVSLRPTKDLPPPARAAERMYGIQYFIRAIGRK
jgi:hypothetical protein